MKVVKCFGLIALMAGATTARGEDLTGIVSILGSDLHAQTHLDPEVNHRGPALCPGEVEQKVRHLPALVVSATGLWQLGKQGERQCFAIKAFKVLRMSSGREAAAGTLTLQDGTFLLSSDEGKVVRLADVPEHLKQMLGQRVILDLREMANPAVKETNKVVVSYRTYP